MRRRLGHVLLALCLAPAAAVAQTTPARDTSAPPAAPAPEGALAPPPLAPTPECAVYSIEGVRLGMSADEARAAAPSLEWTGTMLTDDDRKDRVEKLHLFVRLRQERVSRVMRGYVGMSQAAVRDRFLEHFGTPTKRHAHARSPNSPGNLEPGEFLQWESPTCNVVVSLEIASEERATGERPPSAIATMTERKIEPPPATAPANIKF